MNNTFSHVVIFDGECNFCNAAVNFIIKRDPNGVFKFAPTQSEFAQQRMIDHEVHHLSNDTFFLIKFDPSKQHERCFLRSDAALEVTRNLSGLWHLFRVFKIVPRPLRDACYGLIARNRYRWFGRRDSCMVPTEAIKNRFVGF